MPQTIFPQRILCDKEFIEWFMNTNEIDNRTKFDVTKYLMLIKASSKHHPGEHNQILKEHLDSFKNQTELRRLVSPLSNEDIYEDEKDEGTKVIKAACYLLDSLPHSVYLFTSNTEMKRKYESNSHYANNGNIKQAVIIQEGTSAVFAIKSLFKYYCDNK